jgi:uncharacterized protein YegJ (DUF2314 family)
MNSLTQLIEIFYTEEAMNDERSYETLRQVKFTAQATIEDLAMLDAVAARFGKTRATFTTEIIRNAAIELFSVLTDSDKLKVAEAADTSIAEHMVKAGCTWTEVGFLGRLENQTTHWRDLTQLKSFSPKENEGS